MESAPTLFDAYELRARYFPAVLLAVPFVTLLQIGLSGVAPGIPEVVEKAAASLAIIYVLSLYVRQAGRRTQPRLWASWNGAPSTRFARWRDPEISLSQKTAIHAAVQSAFGIKLSAADEEANDKGHTDLLINEAFDRARVYLRNFDSSGLVAKQNAEYGALRNLLAIRATFTGEAVVCAVVAMALWIAMRRTIYLWCAGAEVAYLVVGVVVGWRLLPSMIKLAADTYGRTAWLTFTEIASKPRG
jgi:hypothetical protein